MTLFAPSSWQHKKTRQGQFLVACWFVAILLGDLSSCISGVWVRMEAQEADVEFCFFFLPCRGPWLCWRSLLSSLPTPWSFARCTAHKPRLPGETHGNCLLHFSLLSCFFSATQQTYRKRPVEKMGRVYAKTVCWNLDSAGLIFFFT